MRNNGFSVFIAFRGRRLTLQRGLPSIEEAFAFVDRIKRVQFQERDDIQVVDERSGQVVLARPSFQESFEPPAEPKAPRDSSKAIAMLLARAMEARANAAAAAVRYRRAARELAEPEISGPRLLTRPSRATRGARPALGTLRARIVSRTRERALQTA